jgi:hypothetical protein
MCVVFWECVLRRAHVLDKVDRVTQRPGRPLVIFESGPRFADSSLVEFDRPIEVPLRVDKGILAGHWNLQGGMEMVHATENPAGLFAKVAARDGQLDQFTLQTVFVCARKPEGWFLTVSSSGVKIVTKAAILEIVNERTQTGINGPPLEEKVSGVVCHPVMGLPFIGCRRSHDDKGTK